MGDRPQNRFDVCIVGSANLDVVVTTSRHPRPGETVHGDEYHEYPGGKGLNQAVAAARSGGSVAFVGAVGTDAAADTLSGVLSADGIDARHVAAAPDPTGRAVIVVDAHGENSIVVVPGANHAVSVDAGLPESRVVLCQLEIPIEVVGSALAAARAMGSVTILNPAPAAAISPDLIAQCDVIVPNQHEVELLGGPAELLGAGCGAVVVTLGAEGADVHTAAGVEHVDSYTVEAVDTTGAGDAFCGSLATRLAGGDDLMSAVRWAVAAGALATTKPGAVPGQPTADEISAFVRGEHHG